METLTGLEGIFWLGLTLAPLVLLQRLLHREIQGVLLILTRNPALAVSLFSILYFPGILLHEGSHFLMAKLLRVPTGRFSVLPRPTSDGRLQLGYVETAPGGVVRDALIGLAPLLAGGGAVAAVALYALRIPILLALLANGQFDLFWQGMAMLLQVQGFWLWFYLVLAVSGTMMPSASDRQAWLPLGLLLLVLLLVALISGAGPWLYTHLAEPLNEAMLGLAFIFGFSGLFQAALLAPVSLFRRLLTRITRLDIR